MRRSVLAAARRSDRLGIEMLEGARLDAARLDERIDLLGLQPDHAAEPIGGQLTLVDEAIERARGDAQPASRLGGHTEILAETCGVTDFAMMLFLPSGERVAAPHGLGVAHVTLHTSIASVPALITHAAVNRTIGLVYTFMQRVGCTSPRIGVCALNPHAGEQGLFGDEERRVIAPAVQQAVLRGINAAGPYPADTMFHADARRTYDVAVAMYHDQALIPVKTLAFDTGVNVTLGLPFVRTSPDHGTAFALAGTGKASPRSLVEALRLAETMARNAGAVP